MLRLPQSFKNSSRIIGFQARRASTRNFSNDEGNGKSDIVLPRKQFNTNLETPHQKAFANEAFLEEVTKDVQHITGWGINQFKVNGVRINGPIILTKKLVFKWKLSKAEPTIQDLTIEDFDLFTIMNPPLDLIILGTGNNIEFPNAQFLKQLRDIAAVEVLDSVNAGATFNLLTKEDRQVAAALLPVLEW
jgi:NADH dehydrogenase [ubiquinone] 1 alpha subcomplex assembly factor 3